MRNVGIDELRALLDLHDRTVVSIVMLQGIVETTDFPEMQRSFAPTDDRAFIFVGPAEKMGAQRRERADGAVVYTFVFQQ